MQYPVIIFDVYIFVDARERDIGREIYVSSEILFIELISTRISLSIIWDTLLA